MSAETKHLDIRKYPNRRYYDATRSKHLTLEDIRSLVRDGYDVTVTDSKSGDDITAQVLTQIILELETPKLGSFPVPLLVRLIRVNDQIVREFIDKYFNQAFQAWVDYQKQFEEQLLKMQGMPGVYAPFAAWNQAFAPPFGSSPKETTARQTSANADQDAQDLKTVIKDLQEQVANLQRDVKRKRKPRAK